MRKQKAEKETTQESKSQEAVTTGKDKRQKKPTN